MLGVIFYILNLATQGFFIFLPATVHAAEMQKVLRVDCEDFSTKQDFLRCHSQEATQSKNASHICCLSISKKSICSKPFIMNKKNKQIVKNLELLAKYKSLDGTALDNAFDIAKYYENTLKPSCEKMKSFGYCEQTSKLERMRESFFKVCSRTDFVSIQESMVNELNTNVATTNTNLSTKIKIAAGCVQKNLFKDLNCAVEASKNWKCCFKTNNKSICSKEFEMSVRNQYWITSAKNFMKYKVLLISEPESDFDFSQILAANQSRFCNGMRRQTQCLPVYQIESIRRAYYESCPTNMFPSVVDPI